MQFTKDAKAVMTAFTKLPLEEQDALIDYMMKHVQEESLSVERFEPNLDFCILKEETLHEFPDDIYSLSLTLTGIISKERMQNDNSIYEKTETTLLELINYLDSL